MFYIICLLTYFNIKIFVCVKKKIANFNYKSFWQLIRKFDDFNIKAIANLFVHGRLEIPEAYSEPN